MNQLNILKMLSRRISSLLAIKNSFSFHTLSKNKSNVGITQFVSKPCYSFGNTKKIFKCFLLIKAYPSHTKITMAALSPTMKTVNEKLNYHLMLFILCIVI